MKHIVIWSLSLIIISLNLWLSKKETIKPLLKNTVTAFSNKNTSSTEQQKFSEDTTNSLEDALGLALKGINLFQGEHGVELWRLKASWAHLSNDGGTVQVENPIVQYTIGNGSTNDIINVTSHKGKITDNQRFITLWDNLSITQDQKNITGPCMIYDATQRTISFPNGASFTSPIATSTAGIVTWNLETNVIKGTHGITAIIYPKN